MAAPIALLVTAPAVAFGVLASGQSTLTSEPTSDNAAALDALSLYELQAGRDSVSRAGSRLGPPSGLRGGAQDASSRRAALAKQAKQAKQQAREQEATQRAVGRADTRLWTTAPLNLWGAPQDDATRFGLTKSGVRVLVTGRRSQGRVELAVGGESRWVTAGYLSEDKPEPEEEGVLGIGGACTNGTSVSGTPNVVSIHQAVCAAFPAITSYGTYRAGSGDHASGRAIDIMISGEQGWDVADFVRANYAALGVSYVIYSQNIWSVDRSGEGWRPMSDRGSTTANHYDHVHVSTY